MVSAVVVVVVVLYDMIFIVERWQQVFFKDVVCVIVIKIPSCLIRKTLLSHVLLFLFVVSLLLFLLLLLLQEIIVVLIMIVMEVMVMIQIFIKFVEVGSVFQVSSSVSVVIVFDAVNVVVVVTVVIAVVVTVVIAVVVTVVSAVVVTVSYQFRLVFTAYLELMWLLLVVFLIQNHFVFKL